MYSHDFQVREFLSLFRHFVDSLGEGANEPHAEIRRLQVRLENAFAVPNSKEGLTSLLGEAAGTIAGLQLPPVRHSERERLAAYAARIAQGRPMKENSDSFETLVFRGYGVEVHRIEDQYFIRYDAAVGEEAHRYQVQISDEEAERAQRGADDVMEILESHAHKATPYGP